jgi:hypothetical protein
VVCNYKTFVEIAKRVLCRLAPRAHPAESSCFAVRKCLPRNRPSAVRIGDRLAVEIDCFMEPAARTIGPNLPPEWKGLLEQPVAKSACFTRHIVHAYVLGGQRVSAFLRT